MSDKCSVCIPTFNFPFCNEHEAECLMKYAHSGEHICQLSNGKHIQWEPDEFACDECEEAEIECECFSWDEISEEEAKELITKSFEE